jgi:hypothetical protein
MGSRFGDRALRIYSTPVTTATLARAFLMPSPRYQTKARCVRRPFNAGLLTSSLSPNLARLGVDDLCGKWQVVVLARRIDGFDPVGELHIRRGVD